MATFHDFNVVLISKLLKLMMYLSVKETNIVTIQRCTNTVLDESGEPVLLGHRHAMLCHAATPAFWERRVQYGRKGYHTESNY